MHHSIKTRAAAVLLALLTGAGCAGCSEKPSEPSAQKEQTENVGTPAGEEAPETEAETEFDPFAELPADTYGGRSFRLLAREAYLYELWVEEMTGDVFNDAVFERNAAVEQRFDVTIDAIPIAGEWGDRDKFLATVRSSVQAGDGAYDLIATLERSALSWGFAAFILALFAAALYSVKKLSREDRFIR